MYKWHIVEVNSYNAWKIYYQDNFITISNKMHNNYQFGNFEYFSPPW